MNRGLLQTPTGAVREKMFHNRGVGNPQPPRYLLDPVGYGDRLHGTSVTLPRAAERLPRTANLLHRDPTPVRSLESLSEEVQPDLELRFDFGRVFPKSVS